MYFCFAVNVTVPGLVRVNVTLPVVLSMVVVPTELLDDTIMPVAQPLLYEPALPPIALVQFAVSGFHAGDHVQEPPTNQHGCATAACPVTLCELASVNVTEHDCTGLVPAVNHCPAVGPLGDNVPFGCVQLPGNKYPPHVVGPSIKFPHV